MDSSGSGKQISVFATIAILRRRKYYLLIPLIAFSAAGLFYAQRVQEKYKGRALVAMEQSRPPVQLTARPEVVAASIQEQLREIRETLLGAPLLETVAREFDLADAKDREAMTRAVDQLRSRIQIQVEGPDAFYVSVEGTSRVQVMQIANRIAESFIARTSDAKGLRVEQVDSFLDVEVDKLRREMDAAEGSVRSYKQTAASALPEMLAANLKLLESVQQQIQSKTDQITEAQARRSAALEEIRTLETQGVLDPEPHVKTPGEVHLDELRLKLRQLKARYTPEHPEIARTEKELRDLEAAGLGAVQPNPRRQSTPAQLRYSTLQGELRSIDMRVKNYLQEREALSADLSRYQRLVNSSPGSESALGQRVRDASLARSRYEALYAKQQEAKLGQRAEATTKPAAYRIAEPATLPSPPTVPQRARVILLGIFVGLALGIAGVFLAEQMDSSFGTIEEFQRYTNLPVLSSIPAITDPSFLARRREGYARRNRFAETGMTAQEARAWHKRRVPVLSDPQSVAAEQYGILSLKVQQWMQQSGGKVLVVTSSAGAEGKSVTAVNVALSLASSMQGGVVLVDADLRRPRLNDYLDLKAAKGLSDLLTNPDSAIADCTTKVRNLDVIPGGSGTPNPVGLLASKRARDIFDDLMHRYRLVVIDSPPIVPTADSHVLAGMANGVLMVVRARQTRRELMRRALESLGPTNVLGVVLNDVEYKDTRYAYAYRYYQRHYLG